MQKQRIFILILILPFFCLSGFTQEFKLDSGHTLIEFNVERFMVGEVTGKFKEYDGSIKLGNDGNPEFASVSIRAASLDSDHEVRDGHLKRASWLDTEKYDRITFESNDIKGEDDQWVIYGDLTIKGKTNPISFPFNPDYSIE